MTLAVLWRSALRQALAWLVLAALGACGSAPPARTGSAPAVAVRAGPAPSSERDGPEARPPQDLARVPDAEPQIEPIRKGGPNKPYEVLGREYVPITDDQPFSERGLASWYGKKFHGRLTSSGEPYDMYAMTAAHPTLPIPSYVRVRNPANAREVVVRVNDRGPFHPGRIIDLSYTAAFRLGLLKGVAPVELTRITFDEIRAGSWRKPGSAPVDPPERAATELAALRVPPVMPPPVTPPLVPAVLASASAPVVAASAAPVASESLPPMVSDAPAVARAAPGYWVQLGAFRQREGAEGFSRRLSADLDWLAPVLAVFSELDTHRLLAGPYNSRDEAIGVARRIRDAVQLVPVVVERR
jgi:rare lipoprotein A